MKKSSKDKLECDCHKKTPTYPVYRSTLHLPECHFYKEEIRTEHKKDSIQGQPITQKKAYEGLGDPSTWDEYKRQLMEEFHKKPSQNTSSLNSPANEAVS